MTFIDPTGYDVYPTSSSTVDVTIQLNLLPGVVLNNDLNNTILQWQAAASSTWSNQQITTNVYFRVSANGQILKYYGGEQYQNNMWYQPNLSNGGNIEANHEWNINMSGNLAAHELGHWLLSNMAPDKYGNIPGWYINETSYGGIMSGACHAGNPHPTATNWATYSGNITQHLYNIANGLQPVFPVSGIPRRF